jgi:hypothetical protein
MHSLAPLIAALHQQDLLDEAELVRQARMYRAVEPDSSTWRRTLARVANGLSYYFASAAGSIDPGSGRAAGGSADRATEAPCLDCEPAALGA